VILLGRKRGNPFELIPGTITAITPNVLCQIDGSATAIKVKVPKYYTPAVNDRVGLVKIGAQYLALSTG
jgi:hypothetical protein